MTARDHRQSHGARLRAHLSDLSRPWMEHGAVHRQLGRSYPFREGLDPQTFRLIADIKRLVDPGNRVNPGKLGLD